MVKKSFILHIDSLSILNEMTDEQAGLLFKSIYNYQTGNEVNLDFAMKMAFAPFKNQFVRDDEKYSEFVSKQKENGKKGGRKQKAKPSQTNPKNPSLFIEPKPSLNDSVSDSKNDSKSKKEIPSEQEFVDYAATQFEKLGKTIAGYEYDVRARYNAWVDNGWRDGKNNSIKVWKSKVNTQMAFFKYIAPTRNIGSITDTYFDTAIKFDPDMDRRNKEYEIELLKTQNHGRPKND